MSNWGSLRSVAVVNERLFLVGCVHDECVHIARTTELQGCARADGDVLDFNAVQRLKILNQDIQETGVTHGGGRCEAKGIG